ncbi:MAG: magnesium transporter, partial [Mycobacterium sp.]
VTGQDVVGADGLTVGRLVDLTMILDGGGGEHVVARLVVARRGAASLMLPWEQVAGLHAGRVDLRIPSSSIAGYQVGSVSAALAGDEILLARDVLDTQVVDIVGQRLARVADVVLTRTRGGALEIVGVEVGFGGVLRRLGLGRLVPRNTEDVVAWPDLHLTSERGHAVQLAAPRSAVHRLEPRGLAALVSRVDTEAATEILAAREPAVAAEAVRATHPEVGERMLRALRGAHADRIVAAMSEEHARHWRDRLSHRSAMHGRRFLRSRVWPHRRHLFRRTST